jgi:lipopolysaccharide heptosyltransferase II
MDILREHIERILVIKLRAIGDVLLSTIVLDSLRHAFPTAQIDFLTERSSREVVEGNRLLDSVIVFDAKSQSGLSLIREVRRRRYDLVIDLFGNPRSALVTYFSGARYRVGYRFKWRQYCYNVVIEPRGGEVHNTQFNLDALRAIGVPIQDESVVFPIDDVSEEFAERFFREVKGTLVVALNPGGGWYTKRWQKFAELGDVLVEKHNTTIVLLWGPGEQTTAEAIQQKMKHAAMLIPRTSLKQLAAILKRCTALVTNDSGPMHIAAAVGTPVVAIFGPTNPKLQGPVGDYHIVVRNERIDCLGCNLTKCPIGNPCMEELSVADVAHAFDRLMAVIR